MKTPIDTRLSTSVRAICAVTGETYDVIGKLIGVKRNTVGMRLYGHTRWALADLEALANHWGCEPHDLLRPSHEALGIVMAAALTAEKDGQAA